MAAQTLSNIGQPSPYLSTDPYAGLAQAQAAAQAGAQGYSFYGLPQPGQPTYGANDPQVPGNPSTPLQYGGQQGAPVGAYDPSHPQGAYALGGGVGAGQTMQGGYGGPGGANGNTGGVVGFQPGIGSFYDANTGVTGYGPGGTTPPQVQGQGQGAAPQITNPHDPAQVRAWFQWQAAQPGADPYLSQPGGIDYYTKAWQDTGDPFDTGYWAPKSTLAQFGGAVGAGSGGAGSPGGLWNTLPTADQYLNSPGAQAALQRGETGLQHLALNRGTGLSGGVIKDAEDFITNNVLTGYNNYAGLKLGYNQANTGNLYNLAQLGLNASSVGSQ